MNPNATTLTRQNGLERLDAFVRDTAANYAAERGIVRSPDSRPTTSVLSPYLRRRLVTEQEVVSAVHAALGEREAAKFVSEVFWRTYFKGYLETHPAAWSNYLSSHRRYRAHRC